MMKNILCFGDSNTFGYIKRFSVSSGSSLDEYFTGKIRE